jgi:protein ImuB
MSRYAAILMEGATRAVLEAVAEIALTFGPRVAIEPDAVVVDVTGCAHLLGGEAELAKKLKARVARLFTMPSKKAPLPEVPQALHTHPRHVKPKPDNVPPPPPVKLKSFGLALDDHPRVALAMARGGGRSFAELPLAALGFDEESLDYFASLSVNTVAELQGLPVFELERRLPASARAAVALAHGHVPDAVEWWMPPEIPESSVELDHGVEHLEPLLFVLKGLVDPLCARLEARGQLLAEAELWVKYEKLPGLEQREQTWQAVFPSALRDAKAVLNVLKLRLEAVGLRAPVREVRLRLLQTVEAEPRALHLWTKETTAVSALPTLIAELVAELGEERVGSLTVQDRHAASSRTALVRVGTMSATPVSPWVSLSYAASEPLRAQKAEPWDGPTSGKLLVRRQGVEWWTHGFSDAWDSLAVWIDGLGATAWVDQRLGDSYRASSWLRGWVDG